MPDHPPPTTGPDLVRVTTCPCGEEHIISRKAWTAAQAAMAGKPPTVPITVPGVGTWKVPRKYFALHKLAALELPELAEKYEWPKVEENNGA